METKDASSSQNDLNKQGSSLGLQSQELPSLTPVMIGATNASIPLMPPFMTDETSERLVAESNLMRMNTNDVGEHLGNTALPELDAVKKKRGRPRKNLADGGNHVVTASSSVLIDAAVGGTHSTAPISTLPISTLPINAAPATSTITPSKKRGGRGRPVGMGKKQEVEVPLIAPVALAAAAPLLQTATSELSPHIIGVAAGEDVAAKIFEFCQAGRQAVCVISANGSISHATLRSDSSSGGQTTYEGRYDIVSVSGNFYPIESNGVWSRAGGLSVALSGSHGTVFGGKVSGMLVAATPILMVLGSFVVPQGTSSGTLSTTTCG